MLLRVTGGLVREHDRSTWTPPTTYDATFPESAKRLLHQRTAVYWKHQIVGHVTYLRDTGSGIYVGFHLEPGFAQRMWDMDGQLQLYRSQADPKVTWLAVFPRSSSS